MTSRLAAMQARPIFVLIVNYRTGRLAVDSISSLAPERAALRGGRVVVVDNDSGDDSLAVIGRAIEERGWQAWVTLIPLPRNGGFAYGNNAAIAWVRELAPHFAFVVLINPDTIARPGVVAQLAARLDAQPSVGVVGGAIESDRGERLASAHAMPSPLGELEASAAFAPLSRLLSRHVVSPPPVDGAHRCDWVSGACMAIRREVLDDVGPFDEGFFLYFEEVDFCRRAAAAGWECWVDADARVVHFEGASTGLTVPSRRLPAYWFASRRRFFLKAYGVTGLLAADLLRTLGRASLLARRALGLGGGQGRGVEPARQTRDLLASDAKALLCGEWRAVAGKR